MAVTGRPSLVLFDLDGTLVDSAPDLAAAANQLRQQRGLPALALAELRPHAGSGARGMLGRALGMTPAMDGYSALKDEFLDLYEQRMLDGTTLFAAVPALLDALQAHGLPWGIVTNKALRFAEPLTEALGLRERACVLIGGDSTPHTKPHPAPLLEAARRAAFEPSACVYVGDDPRDMQAARAARMGALAAAWGYLGLETPVAHWPADAVLNAPEALLKALELA